MDRSEPAFSPSQFLFPITRSHGPAGRLVNPGLMSDKTLRPVEPDIGLKNMADPHRRVDPGCSSEELALALGKATAQGDGTGRPSCAGPIE